MKRREFLRTTIAGALGTLPAVAIAANLSSKRKTELVEPLVSESTTGWTEVSKPFAIDPDGNIVYVGDGERYSVLEFHRFLADEFDKPERLVDPVPTIRHTDHLIQITDGYRVTPNAMAHLQDGGIKQGDEYWANVQVIGRF